MKRQEKKLVSLENHPAHSGGLTSRPPSAKQGRCRQAEHLSASMRWAKGNLRSTESEEPEPRRKRRSQEPSQSWRRWRVPRTSREARRMSWLPEGLKVRNGRFEHSREVEDPDLGSGRWRAKGGPGKRSARPREGLRRGRPRRSWTRRSLWGSRKACGAPELPCRSGGLFSMRRSPFWSPSWIAPDTGAPEEKRVGGEQHRREEEGGKGTS